MMISKRWQSRTALLMALGITSMSALPMLAIAPATARSKPYLVGQLFSQSTRVRIPQGTEIPVRLEDADKLIVAPDETAPVTLIVAADIRSDEGTLLIPEGSTIEGEIQPTDGGTQFVAQELVIRNSNQRIPIDATSEVITETETIERGTDTGKILTDAAIGAAAAAILSEIFGDIDLKEVLGGAGIGALASILLGRSRKKAEVFVLYPETDLTLTLQSDLVLSSQE